MNICTNFKGCNKPVSYTHLADGVKAELTEKQLPEAAINALADFIAAGEVTLDAVAARCADPVSYTHLDVYKRQHQIRAHMASIGCPILGDSKYGNNSANRELKLKYQACLLYTSRCV